MRRRCCVCESALRETVDDRIRRGWAYDRIAAEVGFVFSASAINRHALDCLGHRRKRSSYRRRPAPRSRHPAPLRRRVPWEEIVREVSAHQRRRLGYVRRKDE